MAGPKLPRGACDAALSRLGQSRQTPPFDKPWCFFDLAEIKLYRGDIPGFLQAASTGFKVSDASWQGETFVNTLRLLSPAAAEIPGLQAAQEEVEQAWLWAR